MLFNSIDFALFLPLVFVLYWFAFGRSFYRQNVLLAIASYVFYGWWDWRFLFLLAFSTFLDYYSGKKIHFSSSEKARKIWLVLSIAINLGFLGFFKYYNFFIESFAEMLKGFGLQPHLPTLQLVLPVGISFYTFHGLSYVFDLYKRRIQPASDWVSYSLFVSFFPLLVAGPIERATHLLPQVQRPRFFDYGKAVDGMRQILWGLFKKVVVADNCATLADQIFDTPEMYNGSSLVLGALFFTFQIYGDFSGYSDIALGTARLFGFELMQNFSFPYFSRDIAEFWRRWHMSLSSWFRDYLYIPLGGSRVNTLKQVRNTFIIFVVSGFWHGAKWTFVIWGLLNAIYFLPLLLSKRNRINTNIPAEGKIFPGLRESGMMLLTFSLTVFAWIFFRADTVQKAFEYIGRMFGEGLFSAPLKVPVLVPLVISLLLVTEWLQRDKRHGLQFSLSTRVPQLARWSIYTALFLMVLAFLGKSNSFIYFQF